MLQVDVYYDGIDYCADDDERFGPGPPPDLAPHVRSAIRPVELTRDEDPELQDNRCWIDLSDGHDAAVSRGYWAMEETGLAGLNSPAVADTLGDKPLAVCLSLYLLSWAQSLLLCSSKVALFRTQQHPLWWEQWKNVACSRHMNLP